MNYRLQLSPISSPHDSLSSGEEWDSTPANLQDVKLFRSWLVYDSEFEFNHPRPIDWNVVLGFAGALGISATFWVGVGLAISHLWP